MSAAMTSNAAQFQAAITEYASATRKSVYESMNRGMRNWLVHAATYAQQRQRTEAISALEDKSNSPMWPRTIAKILAKNRTERVGWSWLRKARKSTRLAAEGIYSPGAYRTLAREVSRRIIARRKARVGFIRHFFAYAAMIVEARAGVRSNLSAAGAARIDHTASGFDVEFIKATEAHPRAILEEDYLYVTRGGQSARQAEDLLARYLNEAEPATIEDIKRYAYEKMLEARAVAFVTGRRAA